MRKFTFILAMLLSFAGLAKAQDAENAYDPTTAEGVVPALSSADGTQFAYYLRNVQFPTSFFGTENVAQGYGKGTITNDIATAAKVVMEKTSNGYTLYTLAEDGTRSGNKIKSGSQAPMLWVVNSNDDQYQWQIAALDGDNITYTIKSTSRNKYLYAPAETHAQTTAKPLYGSFSSYVAHMGWQFIPANDAAKAAAALTIKVAEGDAVHGNLATFSASYPTAKPEGYTVYTATKNVANKEVELTELTGNVIPANTGVILKGETNAALAITPSLETATATSELVATNEGTKTVAEGESIYALGVDGAQLAFCKVKANTTIGANKAYLPADAAGALKLSFDGTVTAINHAVVADKSNAPIFDLSGRRVAKANKAGLYIQNGKKFIVK